MNNINHVSIKQISAETFWVGFGVFFSTIGTFVGVRLLTSIMAPEAYGQLALGVSIAMGLVYSIGVAFWGTVTRFFPVAKQDGSAVWYWQSIQRSLVFLSVVFSIMGIMVAFGLKIIGFSNIEAFFWGVAILFGGIQVIGETGSALQNGARNRKIFSLHQNFFGWGRFVLAYLIILCGVPGAEGALLGFVIVALMVAFSQRYWVKKKFWKSGLFKNLIRIEPMNSLTILSHWYLAGFLFGPSCSLIVGL